jgi:hypothetical protein
MNNEILASELIKIAKDLLARIMPVRIDGHHLKFAKGDYEVEITFPDGQVWIASANPNSAEWEYEVEPSRRVQRFLDKNIGYFLPYVD